MLSPTDKVVKVCSTVDADRSAFAAVAVALVSTPSFVTVTVSVAPNQLFPVVRAIDVAIAIAPGVSIVTVKFVASTFCKRL